MELSDVSLICKALSDSNRLEIVRTLANGERCACNLLERFDITQPTLSHHMKCLCDCGLVETRKEGKWSHYSLNCDSFRAFSAYIQGLADCSGTEKGEG